MNNKRVENLFYIPNFIDKDEQACLISEIENKEWNNTLKRRTQHYGYEYNYNKTNNLKEASPFTQNQIAFKKKIQKYLKKHLQLKQDYEFDQLIINEYQPGQGISPHIDNIVLFDHIVVSLSLSSDCIMEFSLEKKVEQVLLERRSLVILDGKARYEWKHSIPSRKKDQGIPRKTRFSLTFRKINSKIKQKNIQS